jgi:Lipocalin-like domain
MSQTGPTMAGEISEIVGTWELVSMSWTYPDGRSIEPWGKPAGRISYDADGNVIAILMHERRNQADGLKADQTTLSSYSAYFGTYEVDTASGIIRHRVKGSLNDNASGELQRTFEFQDGFLILGFTVSNEGVPVTRRLLWKRISDLRSQRHEE